MKLSSRAILAFLAVLVISQWAPCEEYWLQYRTSREPYEIGINAGGARLQMLAAPPEGLALPAEAGFDPLFAKWTTPMARDGFIYVAATRSKERGNHDRLFADTNSDGELADESPIAPYQAYPDMDYSYYGPVEIVFQTGDGPVAYHAKFSFYVRDNKPTGSMSSACWYEGNITLDGASYRVALMDTTGNATFDDTSMDLGKLDSIATATADAKLDTRGLGKYLRIGGKLYCPKPSRDGACLDLAPAENVVTGPVRTTAEVTTLILAGENGDLSFDLVDNKADVPVGKWIVKEWIITRADKAGQKWRLGGHRFAPESAFDAAEGKEVTLDIGEPVKAVVDASDTGEAEHYFSQSLKGKMNERVYVEYADESQPPAPNLRIKNADASYDKVFQFQYG